MWSLLVTVFVAGVVVPATMFAVLGLFGKLGWPVLGLIAAVVVGVAIIDERIKRP